MLERVLAVVRNLLAVTGLLMWYIAFHVTPFQDFHSAIVAWQQSDPQYRGDFHQFYWLFGSGWIIGMLAGVLDSWINHIEEDRRYLKQLPSLPTSIFFLDTAASKAVKLAQFKYKLNLDYSVESLKHVDKIIDKFRNRHQKDFYSVNVQQLSNEFGAYIGEVIRQTETNVKWGRNHPSQGENSFPLYWDTEVCFPIEWCTLRLMHSNVPSIWQKYETLKNEVKNLSNMTQLNQTVEAG